MSRAPERFVTHVAHATPISLEDFHAYHDVFTEAYAIHLDREAVRHGLWKEYPARDQVWQIRVKADRTLRSIDSEDMTEAQRVNAMSELLDIINYANFAYRILNGETAQ